METNGSPPPINETDENHGFLLVILPIHPEATRKITTSEKLVPIEDKTHQLKLETHQLIDETHQNKEFLEEEKLPSDLKLKIADLGKRPNREAFKSMICALCAWKPLTALQISEFLDRKDKKHLVRQHLTPLQKFPLAKETPLQNIVNHLNAESESRGDAEKTNFFSKKVK